jgi:hypothetical protein
MANAEQSLFMRLFKTNVNDKVEKKNGLSYVSWAFAWAEVKKVVPDASYTIYERDTEFGPVNYFTDGRYCWVKTGVTLNGLEHIEELPVMDFKNRSIPLEGVTSMDVNKAIQRSLTKACARHGLGLYIYAGEDLPEDENAVKETAESVGKAKLKEVEAKMVSANAPATPEQLEYIRKNASDELYTQVMQHYGAEMERLTEVNARAVIKRIDNALHTDK